VSQIQRTSGIASLMSEESEYEGRSDVAEYNSTGDSSDDEWADVMPSSSVETDFGGHETSDDTSDEVNAVFSKSPSGERVEIIDSACSHHISPYKEDFASSLNARSQTASEKKKISQGPNLAVSYDSIMIMDSHRNCLILTYPNLCKTWLCVGLT
jgi:hypothetical protein